MAANDENGQAVRTVVNLITNVAKDQNVRYVLTLLDDMLQVGYLFPYYLCSSLILRVRRKKNPKFLTFCTTNG